MSSLIEWLRFGGFPVYFILAFSVAGLINAVRFALSPSEARLGMQRAFTWSTVLTGVAGFAAGIATSCMACADLPPEQAAEWHRYLMMGTAESSTNLILGTALPGLSWFIVAIGLRRIDAEERG